MSLQVWLPLNGNLDNNGTANTTIINSGTTNSSAGKLGSCRNFAAGNYIGFDAANVNNFKIANNLSICCWVKFSSTDSAERYVVSCYETGGAGICWQNQKLNWQIYANSGYRACWSASTVSLNVWHHIVGTFDNRYLKLYIDGALSNTLDLGGNYSITYQATTPWEIGGNPGPGSFASGNLVGLMNDFRLYDNCLSESEVKDLAKGLVLHYPLKDTIGQLSNCFAYPTFNTSASSGGWSHWGPATSSGSYGQTTDSNYIYKPYGSTYAHWFAEAAGTGQYYILYQSPAFSGGYRSLQAIIKEENSLPITDSICCPSWNASTSASIPVAHWTSISSLGNGFYYCKAEGINQDGSDDLVSLLVRPGYKIYVTCCYLENNRQVCTSLIGAGATIYDHSGHNNNGIATGNLVAMPVSPRYQLCTHWPVATSATNTIHTPIIYQSGEAITISVWAKTTTTVNSYQIIFASDSLGYCDMQIYSTGAFVGGLTINGTRYIDAAGSGLLDGNWHMITMTYDGSAIKRYIDGNLAGSTSVSGKLNATAQSYWLGVAGSATAYYSSDVSCSDLRFYATALSAADIKDLYNSPIKITKSGALVTNGEIVE